MQWTDRVLVDVHLQLTHKPVITVAIVMMARDSKVTMPNARRRMWIDDWANLARCGVV